MYDSYDLSNVCTIKEVAPNRVIVEVHADDPLTVARYPFLNSEMKYFTVSTNTMFTIIFKNGRTNSVTAGTLISESFTKLRDSVLKFIKTQGISIHFYYV